MRFGMDAVEFSPVVVKHYDERGYTTYWCAKCGQLVDEYAAQLDDWHCGFAEDYECFAEFVADSVEAWTSNHQQRCEEPISS